MSGQVGIETAGDRRCHRCGEQLVLLARVPHTLTCADGSRMAGSRGISLCAVCHRDDPLAQGLLAFFLLHPTTTDDHVESLAALIVEWVERHDHRLALAKQNIDAEIDAYRRSG